MSSSPLSQGNRENKTTSTAAPTAVKPSNSESGEAVDDSPLAVAHPKDPGISSDAFLGTAESTLTTTVANKDQGDEIATAAAVSFAIATVEGAETESSNHDGPARKKTKTDDTSLENDMTQDVAVSDNSRLLDEYNTVFDTKIHTYYKVSPDSKHLFEGVLLEFLKWTEQATLYKQVFDLLMDGSSDELKSVVTVDVWERTQQYASQLKQRQLTASSSDDEPVAALAIFNAKDLPFIQNNSILTSEHRIVLRAPLSNTGTNATTVRTVELKPHQQQQPLENSNIKRKRNVATTAPGAPRLPPKEQRKYLDGPPTELDVLFGRGGGTNNHKGNILYLQHKLKLQVPYTLVATQKGKKALSQQLVNYVHERGGRFVAREDDDRWFEVDDATARRKASQTLREDKTPRDQESKRKTLWRKWADLEQQQQEQQQPELQQQQQQRTSEDTETDNSHSIKIAENTSGFGSLVPKDIAVREVSTAAKDAEASAAHPLSLQEQKAGETLLELNAATNNATANV